VLSRVGGEHFRELTLEFGSYGSSANGPFFSERERFFTVTWVQRVGKKASN
jgi:hypothetical protein